jgi:ubiquinone/menaquinone biosynthesis C-methylase UbiE
VHFGCTVTALDLTPSYVEVARALTEKVGLADRVQHLVGNALDLPFRDEAFDVVWTQNSGMNIADKETLIRGFHRVLRVGGTYAFQEPMSGGGGPLNFPVMWADDQSTSFLRAPNEMRDLIAQSGFRLQDWDDVSESTVASGPPPPHAVQRIIMGEERAAAIAASARKNLADARLVTVHGVFTKI